MNTNMNTKMAIGILAVSLLVLAERGFSAKPSEPSEASVLFVGEKGMQNKQDHDPLEGGDLKKRQPSIPPPVNDPEMVVKPDVPPDPDAVVIPPPIDSEMAVDPATREPLTPEELEEMNKLGKENPEHEQQELPERK